MFRMGKKSKLLTLSLVLIATTFVLTIFFITKNNLAVNSTNSTLKKFANENNYILTSRNSLVKMHTDIQDIITECDLVFIGTIESVDSPKVIKLESNKNSNNNENVMGSVDLPTKVKVNEVFKGNIGQDEVVNIYQRLGYVFDNTIGAYKDNKEYKEKQIYVFFVTNYKDGYLPYSYKQGQLLVKNNDKLSININQLEDNYEISIDRNNFSMLKDKTTLKELKDALKQK